MRFIISLLFISLPVFAVAATTDDKPLPVVPSINLNRCLLALNSLVDPDSREDPIGSTLMI